MPATVQSGCRAPGCSRPSTLLLSAVTASMLLLLLALVAHAHAVVWYDRVDFWLLYGAENVTVAIVDPDYGPLGSPWEAWMLETLRERIKLVCAYINVGFAEEWRWYWERLVEEKPSWLTSVEYPEWPGEYFVAYWSSAAWKPGGWVDIITEYVRRVVRQGFNCILLDNVDVYNYWVSPEEYGLPLPRIENATRMMALLVQVVANYAHALNASVLINVGSGLELLENDTLVSLIDGVMREDVFVCNGEPCDPNETETVVELLERVASRGKLVIILDYVDDEADELLVLREAGKHGFEAIASYSLNLDELPPYIRGYYGVCKTSAVFAAAVRVRGASRLWLMPGGAASLHGEAMLPTCSGATIAYTLFNGTSYRVVMDGMMLDDSFSAVLASNDTLVYLNTSDSTLRVAGRDRILAKAYAYAPLRSVTCSSTTLILFMTNNSTLAIAAINSSSLRVLCLASNVYPGRYAAICTKDRIYILASDAREAKLYQAYKDNCTEIASGLPPAQPLPSIAKWSNAIAYTSTKGLALVNTRNTLLLPLHLDSMRSILASQLARYYTVTIIDGNVTIIDPPIQPPTPIHNTKPNYPTQAIITITLTAPILATLAIHATRATRNATNTA